MPNYVVSESSKTQLSKKINPLYFFNPCIPLILGLPVSILMKIHTCTQGLRVWVLIGWDKGFIALFRVIQVFFFFFLSLGLEKVW